MLIPVVELQGLDMVFVLQDLELSWLVEVLVLPGWVFVLSGWMFVLPGWVFVLPGRVLQGLGMVLVLPGRELQGLGIVFVIPGGELQGLGRIFVLPGRELQGWVDKLLVLHGTGELFVSLGVYLGWWTVENVKGIWKLNCGEITVDVFCLIVDGIIGTSKLEINCNGNLNKLKESGVDLLAVRDEFVTFWTVDDGLVIKDDDFGTEDGDFGIEDDDFETEDGDLMTETGDFEPDAAGDFVVVDCDFVADNGGSLK